MSDHDVALDQVISLAEFEPLARAAMDPAAFGYVTGGSWDEVSLADNDAAWLRYRFRPRVLIDVAEVDPATTLLGAATAMPVAIAPMAVHSIAHPDGELATIRAAAAAGIPYAHSTTSSRSIEEVAEAAPGRDALVPALRAARPARHGVARPACRRSGLRRDRPDRGPARPRPPAAQPAIRVSDATPRQLR